MFYNETAVKKPSIANGVTAKQDLTGFIGVV